MRTVEIKIYKYDELSGNAQDRVLNDIVNEIIVFTDFEKLNKNTKLYKAYKKCKDLQTDWFLGEYIWNDCQDLVLSRAKANEYYKNGEIYIGD